MLRVNTWALDEVTKNVTEFYWRPKGLVVRKFPTLCSTLQYRCAHTRLRKHTAVVSSKTVKGFATAGGSCFWRFRSLRNGPGVCSTNVPWACYRGFGFPIFYCTSALLAAQQSSMECCPALSISSAKPVFFARTTAKKKQMIRLIDIALVGTDSKC